jgi:D-amino-acid oxidase
MNIAVIGAGVSGLTTGILLAERGHDVTIYNAPAAHMASPAAAAVWFIYEVEGDRVEEWAHRTFRVLEALVPVPGSGVSMIETRFFGMPPPPWRRDIEFRSIPGGGLAATLPLMETAIYRDYLRRRFAGAMRDVEPFEALSAVPKGHELIVNCSGIGARSLVGDEAMKPHRGQVVLSDAQPRLTHAVVDEESLMYVIPRSGDCVLGGTNEESWKTEADEAQTEKIRALCTKYVSESTAWTPKVGLRPYREGSVRLGEDTAPDGRRVIHNYGHGGSGFTLSWGCAADVAGLV